MNIIKPKDLEQPFRVGVVVSKENDIVAQRIFEGAVGRLNELKITTDLITVAWVPTAMEIPIVVERMIDTGEIHVVVALGAVIEDGTRHFDFECKQVSDGCLSISMESGIPVIFGVLTTPNEQSALERAGGGNGNIGREVIDNAFETLSVVRQVDELTFG